jgi:hypothetical protein
MHRIGTWAFCVIAGILATRGLPLADPRAMADEPHAEDRLERFRTLMTGATLVGSFTTDADPSARNQERYVVSAAVQLPGDLWLLTTRITYGQVDLTVPVPVAVRWAGDTPVITLDSVAIPGLGTFSSRVVLDRDRYAGTWQHDDTGGHLFGRIERADAGAGVPPSADQPTPHKAAPRQSPQAPLEGHAR